MTEAVVDTGEAHEGEGKETGSDKDDGHATHAFGDVGESHLFANACEDSQGKRKAKGRREGIDGALE